MFEFGISKSEFGNFCGKKMMKEMQEFPNLKIFYALDFVAFSVAGWGMFCASVLIHDWSEVWDFFGKFLAESLEKLLILQWFQ